jgi:hypothetical protein
MPAKVQGLFVAELNEVAVVHDDLGALVLGLFEELGEGEPLAGLGVMVRRTSLSYERGDSTIVHRSFV